MTVNKTDTQIPQLIINKLTKEQYEEALAQGLISETELYAVTDEDDYVTVNAFNNIIANYTTTENLANVALSGEYSDLLNKPELSNVALSGEYSDLLNKPELSNVALSGEYSDLLNTPTIDQTYNGSSANAQSGVAISGLIANYSTTDAFSNVAFSGEYSDLLNIPEAATVDQTYNGSSTNAQSGVAISGLIANYTTTENLANVALSGEYSDLLNKPSLATVATSGEYSDLLNTPTIDQTYNGTSTNAQSGTAIANLIANYSTTDSFSNVAFSGDFADLTNVPAEATVDQVYNSSSANAQSGVAISGLIANYSTTDSFSNVAFSGEYSDLLNTPTIDQTYNASSANAQSGTAVAGLIANYMTSTEVASAISNAIASVYRYKGSVATYADLPSSGQEVGDVYNVEEDGANYAWTGTAWDKLSENLSNYVTINGAATLTNKTIDLADNTIIGLSPVATSGEYSDLLNKPTIDQTYNASSANAQSGVAISGLIANYTTTADLANVALSGEYSDLLNVPTIDQTYNASSANAQSGTAVANAISDMQVISNMVDVVSNTSNNTTYPTASAVYNSIANLSGVVFREWE